jgi:hypothetical protein
LFEQADKPIDNIAATTIFITKNFILTPEKSILNHFNRIRKPETGSGTKQLQLAAGAVSEQTL